MENKQHRSFLEICQEFVKVSEIATPFLKYDGVEPAINLQKSAHENHLKDLRREAEDLIDADRKAASEVRLEDFKKKLKEALDATTPEQLMAELRECGAVFEGDVKDGWEI